MADTRSVTKYDSVEKKRHNKFISENKNSLNSVITWILGKFGSVKYSKVNNFVGIQI